MPEFSPAKMAIANPSCMDGPLCGLIATDAGVEELASVGRHSPSFTLPQFGQVIAN